MTMAGSGWAKSGDEIHPPLRPERVQELVHHRPHVRFEPGNVPREERVLHLARRKLPVAGRIVEYHPVRQGSGEETRCPRGPSPPLCRCSNRPIFSTDSPRVEEGPAHVGVAGQGPQPPSEAFQCTGACSRRWL